MPIYYTGNTSLKGFPKREDFNGSISGSEISISNSSSGGGGSVATSSIAIGKRSGIRVIQTGNTGGLSKSQDSGSVGQGIINLLNYTNIVTFNIRTPGKPVIGLENYEFMCGAASGNGGSNTLIPAHGIYFWYNPSDLTYAPGTQHNFRARVNVGVNTLQIDTGIEMNSLSIYQIFEIRIFDADKKIEFYYSEDDGSELQLISTILESDLIANSIPTIWSNAYGFAPTWGVLKGSPSNSTRRQLLIDWFEIDKQE